MLKIPESIKNKTKLQNGNNEEVGENLQERFKNLQQSSRKIKDENVSWLRKKRERNKVILKLKKKKKDKSADLSESFESRIGWQ